MTETSAKRRWVVCRCGCIWPDQAGERVNARGDYAYGVKPPNRKALQVRGVGAGVFCLVCRRPTNVVAYLWRWPDELDGFVWYGDDPRKHEAQSRLQEERDAAVRRR